MTTSTEQLLREVFAEQAAPVRSTTDIYLAARERNRLRRRNQVIAAAVAAAVVATGVPVTLAAVRGGSAAPTAVTPTPGTPTVAVPTGATQHVRGSLAGDKALLQAAVQLLAADSSVEPASIHVSYADQTDGYRIVVLAGKRSDGTVVSLIAGNAPGARLASVVESTGKPQSIDAGAGQQYYAPEHVLTRFTIGDRSFGLALFPDGYRATIKRRPSIAADCTLETAAATALAVPSFFAIDRGDAPNVAVYAPGKTKPATSRALQPTGNAAALPTLPSQGEIADQIRATMRGKKDVADELAGYVDPVVYGTGVGTLPDRFVGVWAGDLPTGNGYAALFGARFASGASVLLGQASQPNGSGFSGWLTGCVRAGGLDHTVLSARLRYQNTNIIGDPIVIVAPATAVRAEVSFHSGATVSVPLTQGGGFLNHDGLARQVRALDAAGNVVGTGVVDQLPPGLPLQPR
jgi:hypothetical protein